MRKFFTIILVAISLDCFGVEQQPNTSGYELVMIQALSKSRRTFVTRTGKKQGITKGQRATFTTRDLSVVARALEVTRQYTQWEMVDLDASVPFERGEIVTFNNSPDTLWFFREREIPQKLHRYYDESSLQFKGALSQAYFESIDRVQSSNETVRTGQSFDMLYQRNWTLSTFWSTGLRYDQEVAVTPLVRATTIRLMVLIGMEYHFQPFEGKESNVYLGLTAGFGPSSTTLDQETHGGYSYLLPSPKLGYLLPFNRNYACLVEGGFETVYMQENLPVGTSQSTTLFSGKISVGLKFRL